MKSPRTLAELTLRRQRLTASWLSGRLTTREFHHRLFTLCRHLAIPASGPKACP
jgi:hypothetical protein